ncbi:MAG: hypothetical protein H6Q36_591 [Chloroflexi bacterium]|nr:hypothetical protein [Chloroflexota bacterium]
MNRVMATLAVVLVAALLLAGCDDEQAGGSPASSPPQSADEPDLVLADIILVPRPADYGYEGDVIINTVIRNEGADCTQAFVVWCSFDCDGSATYFSGMDAPNGLPGGREITLGDDALLSLSSCSSLPERRFSCTVDSENRVAESDESDNTREEVLPTGR